MIIDGDCHLGTQTGELTISAEDLIRQMDANVVDQAVVWPLAAYARDFFADNELIHTSALKHADRLIPFGGINPRLGLERSMHDLKQCRDWGFRGVKFNGARDGYRIDDPDISLPLIEQLARDGLIAAFHCGSNDFERTHPYRVANIARQFPQLAIWMVHMGGVGRPDEHLHEAAIEFAAAHPNILLIASEAHPRYILKAIHRLGADRVCYASDTPFQLMHVMLAMIQALLRDLPAAERSLIMGENLARVLMR